MRSLRLMIRKILRRIQIFVLGFQPSLGYQIPLPELIRRAEARNKDRRMGPYPPICPHCKGSMMLRGSVIAGGGFAGAPRGSPIRDDQQWKCPKCFHTCHFGIPISREEAEEEVRLRGGTIISRPTFRRDEGARKEVRERLRALGYIDF